MSIHGSARNSLTEGFLRSIPLEHYLKVTPESRFIWKPYKQKMSLILRTQW